MPTHAAPSAPKAAAPKPPSPSPPPASDDDTADDDREPTLPSDTPGAQLEASAKTRGPEKRLRLVDAVKLVEAGKVDEAVLELYQLRKHEPRNPEVALWLGHAYFRKLWRTDGLREYSVALAMRPAARRNGQLLRNVVAALDDPTFRLARSLLKKRIGAAAIGELHRAARDSRSQKVQARAAHLAAELSHHRR
jgi:hypothetical protein